METIRLIFRSSRPISWVNTAYPFALGYLMLGGGFDSLLIVATVFFLIPYNMIVYGINDVFDYESDMRNPRKGGIEGAVTPQRFHRPIIMTTIGTSLPFVVYLMSIGSLTSNLVLVGIIFFALAYSVKGLRFKELPIVDSITSSLHFVGPLVYALTWAGVNQAAWLAAIAFFLWGMASHAFGAVQDIKPDREAEINSIATQLGARFTVRLALVAYLLASITVSLIGPMAWPVALAGLLYVVNVWPYRLLSDENSDRANRGWRRFLWLNMITGAVVTISCVAAVVV